MTTDNGEMKPPVTKGSLRTIIFSSQNKDKKAILVPFYGAEIEIRQPSVGEIEKLIDKETQRMSFVQVLIDHAYVPGSPEKVFTAADYDELRDLPYSGDMAKVAETITALTNVNLKAAEKN